MGVPRDQFDSLMYLSRFDDSVAGAYERPQSGGADTARPSVIQRAGDGTEQLRSAANTKHNAEVPRGGTAEQNKWPSGVADFDPINLTPPAQDKALKHGPWDHS